VILEFALALVLVVGVGILVKSFMRVMRRTNFSLPVAVAPPNSTTRKGLPR
jgi:hypothetical protein